MEATPQQDQLFANLFSEEAFASTDLVDKEEKTDFTDENIYAPSLPDKGSYKAIIRFLPYYLDPKAKSKIKKFQYFFRRENGIPGGLFDCPSSLGRGHSGIFTDAFFVLREHPNSLYQDLQKNFKRKVRYFSPIQIIQDTQNPELNGQIKIFRFGGQVNDIIEQLITGDPSMGIPSVNPYDLLNGRDFVLSIDRKTYGNGSSGPSYEKSVFQTASKAMLVPGFNDNDRENITKEGLKQAIFEYLKGTPDISAYEYKPMDDEAKQRATNIVRTIVQDENVFATIIKRGAKGGRDYSEFAKNSRKGEAPQAEPDALQEMEVDGGEPVLSGNGGSVNTDVDLGDIDSDVTAIADEIRTGNTTQEEPPFDADATATPPPTQEESSDDMSDVLDEIESLDLTGM